MLDFLHLAFLLVLACASAGLSLLLSYCFKRGKIFGFWLPFVAAQLLKDTPERREALKKCKFDEEQDELLLAWADKDVPLIKPFGRCLYCMNVWVAQALFVAACVLFGVPFFYGLIFIGLIFIGLAHFILFIASKE